MWMRTSPGNTFIWQNALAYANGLNATNLCGYNSGWRLPNILELESLVNLGQAGSATWLTRPENGFVGIAANRYWSSTTASSAKNMAWFIDFADDSRDLSVKSLSSLAWPVRGETTTSPAQLWETGQTECYNESGDSIACANTGQDGEVRAGVTWPTPRFADPENGMVRDNLTGLIWTADANTPGPASCSPGEGKIIYDAYLYMQCLNNSVYLGYSDWRIPNRKELESLIDHSRSNPAIPQEHPFSGEILAYYWTSDTNVGQYPLGWAVDMSTGSATVLYKNVDTNTFSLWPVRGPLSLKVIFNGDGQGTIQGDGISCSGNRCFGVFSGGEEVTVTAVNSSDSVFVGWTGCPSPSGNECMITMNSTDVTVTATFLSAKSIWDKPASINFGKVGVGVPSPLKYISVKNQYTTDLRVDSVSRSGANAPDFITDENCTHAMLPPGGSCSIILTVTAQGYGARSAELLVSFSGAIASSSRMKLKAKALPAKIVVDPKTMKFGEVSTQTSTEQQLTIENKGPTDLNILSITKTGDHSDDFSFDASGCNVIQQDQLCSFPVRFSPGGIGKRTGALMITSDAPKRGTVSVSLKGEGI